MLESESVRQPRAARKHWRAMPSTDCGPQNASYYIGSVTPSGLCRVPQSDDMRAEYTTKEKKAEREKQKEKLRAELEDQLNHHPKKAEEPAPAASSMAGLMGKVCANTTPNAHF